MCGPSEDMPVHNFRLAAQTAHSFGDSVIHLTDPVVHIALNILRRASRIKAKWEQGNSAEGEELRIHLKFTASNQRPLVILVNVIGTEGKATGSEEETGGKENPIAIS
jgi:hypothetical protein